MSVRWFYLPGKAFVATWKDGVLKTSPDMETVLRNAKANVPSSYYDCRPVVWFSADETWESSTAMRLRRADGTTTWLTDVESNARHGGGMYRIGVAPETAPISWTDYRKGGFDRPEVCNRLAKAAKELHADPKKWWASDKAVPRELWTRVEVWKDGRWSPWTAPATA